MKLIALRVALVVLVTTIGSGCQTLVESDRARQDRHHAEREQFEQLRSKREAEREAKEAEQLQERMAREEAIAQRWAEAKARSEARAQERRAIEEKREREREAFIKANPSLSESDKDLIRRGGVVLGMDKHSVWKCLGLPERSNKSVSARGTRETWIYPNRFLYFEDGVLTSWHERY